MSAGHPMQPQSREAEAGVACALMSGSELLVEELIAMHTPEHFWRPDTKCVFEAVSALREKKAGLDFITITQWLRDNGRLEAAGGAANVTELATYLPSLSLARDYSRIVTEKFRLRKIIEVARDAEQRAMQQEEDATVLLEDVQGDLLEIAQAGHEANSLRHVKDDLVAGMLRIEALYDRRGQLDGLPTGFTDLDRMLNGLKKACVYVIAGRPAMGKTSFGLAIGEHVALACMEQKIGVAIFSIEMTREQVIDRIFSAHAEVTQEKIKRGLLAHRDFDRLAQTAQTFAHSQLFIDDTGGLTTAKFQAQARRAVIKHNCQLIVIDHVLLMKGVSKRARENRQVEMNEIMECIATTAKALKIPIIVLAQINRTGEERRNSRPALSDLKESGAIEEWAYMVGILYRPVYYTKTDEEKASAAEKLKMTAEQFETYAELDVAKHRNGGVGTVKLKFIGEFTRYEDIAERPLYSSNPALRQGGENRQTGDTEEGES